MSIYYEKLIERDLWIDGQSSLSVDAVCNRIFSGEDIFNVFANNLISERDKKEVQRFLKLVPGISDTRVSYKEKSSITNFDTTFNITEKYKTLNIERFLVKKLKNEIHKKNFSDEDYMQRIERIELELDLFAKHGLYDVLSACVYIVDTLNNNNIVWGPGRGSACCSYLLYLIGIHSIDSVAFDLEIHEFLR